jgi:hypothetical protein
MECTRMPTHAQHGRASTGILSRQGCTSSTTFARLRNRLLPCLALLLLPGTARGAEDCRLLNGFNDETETARFGFAKQLKVELVADHATEGAKAARITCPPKLDWCGLSMRGDILSRWGDYDYFTFDVFNPADAAIKLYIRIDDDKSRNDDYSTQYGREFTLQPGANQIKIKTTRLPNQVQPWLQRQLDPNKLKLVAIWFPNNQTAEATLYFDNFALLKNPKVELPKAVRAFHFGRKDSDCWPGFTAVNPESKYADETGYGFAGPQKLTGLDDMMGEGCKSGELLCGSGVYRTNGSPLTFTVRLAPGKYKLWCAAGMTVFPKRAYTVSLNGRQIFQSKAGDRFKDLDPIGRDYTRKTTLFESHILGQLCDEFAAEVDIPGDKAEIALEGQYASWLSGGLRALVLYPAGDAEAEKAFADVQRLRKEEFLRAWRELKPYVTAAPCEPTAEERARGFMLACRHYCETITPDFVPKSEDRLAKLSIAATPGEREPAVFIVYPTQDAEKAEAQVGDLVGPAGTIPATAVNIGYVHYLYLKGDGGINVVPSYVVPRNYVALEKAVSRQFWMTVTIPETAAPGTYTGTVTVTAAAGKATFPLEVEVYPFKLASVAECGLIYAHLFGVPEAMEDFDAGVRCLAAHNCNSVTLGSVIRLDRGQYQKAGKVVLDLDRLDQAMDVMKKAGMTGPVPLFDMSIQGEGGGNSYSHLGLGTGGALKKQSYFDAMTEVTRQINERAKAKGYLPVLMYPVTELSNDPGMGPAYLEQLVRSFRKVDGVTLVCSLNTPQDIVCAKILDHMMVNWGLNLTEERLAQIRRDGAKLWFQNIGHRRYTEGFLMLKAGAIGRRQFTVSLLGPGNGGDTQGGDPYNCFRGGGNSSMFRTADGVMPNVTLEWMAEGADDYRYAHKLLTLIKQANATGPDPAKRTALDAQKAYDAILAQLRTNTGGGKIEIDGRCDNLGDFTDKSTYDRFRKTVADHIMALTKAMRKT